MNFFKMILIILYSLSALKVTAKSIAIPELKNGLYSSKVKTCADKEVLRISRGDEEFYLLGKNSRFLIHPKLKVAQEDFGGCHYDYRSENIGNELIEQEIRSPCLESKISIITTSTLKIRSQSSFELSETGKETCLYTWKEDL